MIDNFEIHWVDTNRVLFFVCRLKSVLKVTNYLGAHLQERKPKQNKHSKAKNKHLESIIAAYFDFAFV